MFIELLVDDIEMYNPKAWTFIFDKQKCLVDFISKFYKGVDHSYCARHLYNNYLGIQRLDL